MDRLDSAFMACCCTASRLTNPWDGASAQCRSGAIGPYGETTLSVYHRDRL